MKGAIRKPDMLVHARAFPRVDNRTAATRPPTTRQLVSTVGATARLRSAAQGVAFASTRASRCAPAGSGHVHYIGPSHVNQPVTLARHLLVPDASRPTRRVGTGGAIDCIPVEPRRHPLPVMPSRDLARVDSNSTRVPGSGVRAAWRDPRIRDVTRLPILLCSAEAHGLAGWCRPSHIPKTQIAPPKIQPVGIQPLRLGDPRTRAGTATSSGRDSQSNAKYTPAQPCQAAA